jgi:uncharacterized protein
MERFSRENPTEVTKPEPDPLMEILAKKGIDYETRTLKKFKKSYSHVVEITTKQDFNKSVNDTVIAMKAGADIIYQAALQNENLYGYSDFLIKIEGKSHFGDYSYEVCDTKLARSAKPEYILQLTAYSEMLSQIQKFQPRELHILLGDETKQSYIVNDYINYYRHFLNQFLNFHNDFNPKKRPLPQAWEKLGVWEDYANEILMELDHLSFVAGISHNQITKLAEAKITTMAALANAKPNAGPESMAIETFDKLRRQAFLQKQTKKLGKTQYEIRQLETSGSYGLQKLPPVDKADVYFDMEGFPLGNEPLEYLFGAIYIKNSKPTFTDWWALTKADEKVAFEKWIDWIYQRWVQNPNMHIYHYAAYETTAMKRLMGLYVTREFEIDQLLRHNVFIDLYQIVREGLIVGEESYSIKKLEGLYQFKRKSDVKNASDSVIQFAQWMELQDGDSHQTSTILKEIRDYNEEDCVSTLALTEWLRTVQNSNKIKYLSENKNNPDIERSKHATQELAERLLATLPKDKQKEEIQKILALAVGYHRREDKPQWWDYFRRLDTLPTDLVDDLNCLAHCKVVKADAKTVQIKFDPTQETKLNIEDIFCLHHDASIKGEVSTIDFINGAAEIELTKIVELPKFITLIPQQPLNKAAIEKAISIIAETWFTNKKKSDLSPALFDLLTRSKPRFKKKLKSTKSIIADQNNLVDESCVAAENLDASILAIQGPPGTGKTYTAAKMIISLMAQGKKIGITSNSHKAINHLIEEVHKHLSIKNRKNYNFYKVRSKKEDEFLLNTGTLYSTSAGAFWKSKREFNLVGGTAWFFAAKDTAENVFNYLFIEEAGQFSLASAIACQRAAPNLVLLGDQMQLEQPIQGAHPEEIKASVLGYYLQGLAAVPDDMGIFLAQSRRMRPEVCQFISEAIYDNKLASHPTTKKYQLEIPLKPPINKDRGILFIPVHHQGNTQGSDEEVAAISEIIKHFKKAKVSDPNGARSFHLDDCLFVAPYNLQVGKLKQSLGAAAKVGSVDLFQGQEAPIVILSMCSSDAESTSRGLSFLLSKNRINVALSRAKTLAIVVASPKLAEARVTSISNMALLNIFCKILENETT